MAPSNGTDARLGRETVERIDDVDVLATLPHSAIGWQVDAGTCCSTSRHREVITGNGAVAGLDNRISRGRHRPRGERYSANVATKGGQPIDRRRKHGTVLWICDLVANRL
jgi:hypothetical protein